MAEFNDFLVQIFQPYFLYSLVFLSLAFICIKIYLKFNPYLSRRYQSLLWLLPLFLPVIIFLCFPPQTLIVAIPFAPANIQVPCPLNGNRVLFLGQNVFSFTGILCLSSITAATGYFVFMLFFGKRLAMHRFHVVLMANNEYVALQEKVKKTAEWLKISVPKVALVDDLLPNAFTLGFGRGTVVVFSLGLLEMLDSEELAAVVSHELSHVKAKDYLFKSLSCMLNIASFFNPIAYLAASHAQKERELLADQKGAALLNKPMLMANVLTKLQAATLQFPKASLMDRLSASLFLVSPLAHRPSVLASHPQISQRVQNIQAITYKPTIKHQKMAAGLFLLVVLLSLTFMVGYSTIQVQKSYSNNANGPLNQYRVLLYNETALDGNPKIFYGYIFPDYESYLNFTSSQPHSWRDSLSYTYTFPNGTRICFHNVNLLGWNAKEACWE